MSAGVMRAGLSVALRRVLPAVLISLTVGLGLPAAVPQVALAAAQASSSISAGGGLSCAIESGKAYCWGGNTFGGLGDGNTNDSSVPVAVDTSGALAGKTLTQVTVSGGSNYACALDSAGAAYCWGENESGELGDGSTNDSSVPVAVDTSGVLAGKNLTQITAGGFGDTCALDSAGAAYCWGGNPNGVLGDGSTGDSSVPVAVDTSGVLAGKTLTQITAGGNETCAVDSAGAAYCWGYGGDGELGNGSTTVNSDSPVAVDASGVLAGKTLTQVAAGNDYVCVVDSAGAAYCWGDNVRGVLGDGRIGFAARSTVPVAVDASGALAGKTLALITAETASNHVCALDSAGAAYCWGDNTYGELGDGDAGGPSDSPVAVDTSGVLAGKNLTQVTAGLDYTCALDSAGAVYCWGLNGGDLGNGSTSNYSVVPVLAGPQPPARVTAVPGNTTAKVSWTAPASLDGGALAGYTATAAPGGAACATTGAGTCIITGLANGTTYTVTVIAHTTAGDSGASTPATVTPEATGPPAGPIVSGYRKTKCVDDSNDSSANDTKIVMWDCNGTAEQTWTIEPAGTIRINGKCMDIAPDSKANKARVELLTCTGGGSQQWRPRNGTLVNPVSGKCLDDPRFNTADGTQLEIYTCNGGANQQWKLP